MSAVPRFFEKKDVAVADRQGGHILGLIDLVCETHARCGAAAECRKLRWVVTKPGLQHCNAPDLIGREMTRRALPRHKSTHTFGAQRSAEAAIVALEELAGD